MAVADDLLLRHLAQLENQRLHTRPVVKARFGQNFPHERGCLVHVRIQHGAAHVQNGRRHFRTAGHDAQLERQLADIALDGLEEG